jgi:hypothetical protein
MSRLEWVADCWRRALDAEDDDRLRLISLLQGSYHHRDRDPGRAVALCAEGRLLARRLGEPGWGLCFQAEEVAVFVHSLRDFCRAFDLAVAAALEARKPAYDGCPYRLCIYQDLLAVHFCTDPLGHADRIEEGFRAVEAGLDTSLSSRLHLLNLRRWCAEQSRRTREHFTAAQRILAVIAGDPRNRSAVHYSAFVYGGLCRVHFARGEWRELGEAASLAEEASRNTGGQVELATAHLWQSLAALQAGDVPRAHRLRLRGCRIMAGLGVPPPDGYFEALCACHEYAGRPAEALAVRDRELALLRSQGRTISEVYCQQERARLLAGLGRSADFDLEAARAAARRLRFPEPHLAELERLAGRGPCAS